MEYVYAALILHKADRDITEDNVRRSSTPRVSMSTRIAFARSWPHWTT
jgi:hypothetical protein